MIGKLFAIIPGSILLGYTWFLFNVFENLVKAVGAGGVVGYALLFIILVPLGRFVCPILGLITLAIIMEG